MPYTTSTQDAQASCAKYFMENALHTALTAVYTYVEEVVGGSPASTTCRIYKSLGASNSFGQDWFLIVKRTTDSTTTISFGATEQYNSTSHLCFNYMPSNPSQIPTAAPEFAVPDPAGKAPYHSDIATYGSLQISATGFQFWFSTLGNRFFGATRVSGNSYAVYAGLYQDLLPNTISKFPLTLLTANNAYYTREPNTTTTGSYNWTNYSQSTGQAWSFAHDLEPYSGRAVISKIMLFGSKSGMRGLLYDVYSGHGYGTGTTGDTINGTLNGVSKPMVLLPRGTYIPTSPGLYWWVETGI